MTTTIESLFGTRIAEVIPDVIGTAAAADARDRLERAGYARFALLDRGSYDVVHSPAEPELLGALAALASQRTGRPLAVVDARVLRLVAGDYLLAHHDQVHVDLPIELVLDLSPAPVPGAAVHYRRRGQAFFVVPSAPGTLSIVERGPTVMCNHTYVSKRFSDACVIRLVALLR